MLPIHVLMIQSLKYILCSGDELRVKLFSYLGHVALAHVSVSSKIKADACQDPCFYSQHI